MRPTFAMSASCLALMLPGAAAADPVTSPDFPGVVCETIWVPMRDGTLLATDRYSPAAAAPTPAPATAGW